MGYKSALRSIGAMARKAERNSIRRHNELVRQQKQYEKMAELERAAYEVEEYENRLEQLLSIHQDVGPTLDWTRIAEKSPPSKPVRLSIAEAQASEALANYRPSVFDKLLRKVEKKTKQLTSAVETGRQTDDRRFEDQQTEYRSQMNEHAESVDLAQKVLSGDVESYREVVQELSPFSELSELGSSLTFHFHSSKRASVVVNVQSDTAIPKFSKTLLKSGRLSTKEMQPGKFNEIYQDYVCSSVLRVAREMFALLPLEEAVITAMAKLLDTSTGRLEEKCILSALVPRETLGQLDFGRIDPSDAMKNFKHNMGFKRSIGLSAVSELE